MTVPVPLTMPAAAGAQLLASAWADYYAGLWRGDASVSEFAEWLAGFWEETLDRPEGEPAAVSPHAAGGRGIDWFESAGWVSGHIRGRNGGYLVPIAAILRQPWSLRVVPAA
ncbi:MAG: hypothetical protein U0031_13100 [Thermomicrobiales bacterium]